MSDGSITTEKWIRRFHRAPQAGIRLACLPHAGGSATFFLNTSRALSPEIDVLAVQYPGRMDRYTEPLVDGMFRLADLVTDALLPLTDRPLALVVSGRPAHTHPGGHFYLAGPDSPLIPHLSRLKAAVSVPADSRSAATDS